MRSYPLWIGTLLAVGLVATASKSGQAEQPKAGAALDAKAIDAHVYKSLRDIINKGADLYNPPNSDYSGCWRLYEGALLATRPLLDHRPGLQADISAALAAAERTPTMDRRAFVLREIIDKLRTETNPTPKPATTTTLWERLGGEANVKKVIDDFVAAGATDTKVDFFRGGKYKIDAAGVANLKKQLVDLVSQVSGGPYKYTGKSMKEIHLGMGITDAQFNALAAHLKTALEKNGAKSADVAAVMTVIGGTRKDIVEDKKPETTPPATTLWERLGGEANVKKVVDDFVLLAAGDAKVNFFRDGKYKLDGEGVTKLKKGLVDFISSATGGPFKYTGKSMREAHKGMGITDAEFDAIAADLKKALETNGAKPADVADVLKAVAGTRKDIVEENKPETSSETKLWDRLGGEKNVAKVVDDLFKTAGADPKVNFFRDPGFKPTAEEVAALKKKVIDFFSSVSGGPFKYAGKDMKTAHKGMKITDAEFDAFAGHLKKALEDNGAKPADVKIVLDVVGTTRKDIVESK